MGGVFCRESCREFEEKIKCESKNSSIPWHSDVEVDWNGCRKFPRLPPPGNHPRLLFSKDEIPSIVARFTCSEFSSKLKLILDATRKSFLKEIDNPIAALDIQDHDETLDREIVDRFFKPSEQQYVNILGAYVYGKIYNNNEISVKAKKAALFYARLILQSKEIALEDDRDGLLVAEPYFTWLVDKWELKTGWLLGGAPFAMMYDLVFNEMSTEEQNLMRLAITTSVKGRRSWGMGSSTRKIQSNWAAYHGDLLMMCAAVEDEKGFDPDVFSVFSDLIVHYLDYGFYDSGHPIEDSYAINLGLREGSICAVSMARRGHNVFNHPHYRKIWTNWFPYALEPQNSGRVYGGSSGNAYIYPTSMIIAKYMFPTDRIVDYVYRHYMCEDGKDFSRILKLQSRLAALIFAIPALPPNLEEPQRQEKLNLPLTFVCRNRGKVAMRSTWSKDAMSCTLDARPDCFLIGHDTCSRGAFVLNADGRAWGFCPEWKFYKESRDYSLPSIDSVGQLDKAPFVKLQEVIQGPSNSTFVSADLTYAYNWTWTTWARREQDFTTSGYEREPHDPRAFGFRVWWAPDKLYSERDVGFCGLYQWRKRFANVERVFRSFLFVRAKHPFIIVVDDVKKDCDLHQYSWAMTTPDDVELLSYANGDAILSETEGQGRRFLIRNICHDSLQLDCSFRRISTPGNSLAPEDRARQVLFQSKSQEVQFRFLLYSLPAPDSEPPTITLNDQGTLMKLQDGQSNETHTVSFESGNDKACTISLI